MENKAIKKDGVPFIKSLKFKLTLAIMIMVVCICTTLVLQASSLAGDALEEKNSDYIYSVLTNISTGVDSVDASTTDPSVYAPMIANLTIRDVDSSYGYLVAGDGTMLYHPTESKIGQPVENEVILGVVADLAAGKKVETTITTYMYHGVEKLAGYAVVSGNRIIVLTCDKSELDAPKHAIAKKMVIMEVVVEIFYLFVAVIVTKLLIAAPIGSLTKVINKTGDLDLTKDDSYQKVTKRSDEIGYMAKSITALCDRLREMVGKINDANAAIGQNVEGIKAGGVEVNDMCADNSATSEELAAGMEETSATTLGITDTIGEINEHATGIMNMAQESVTVSDEIMGRAKGLKEKTVVATQNTMNIYEDIKVKSAEAIEGAKAVEKINAMTDTIMEISSQTRLLALNASIEAARAGEAGRGFAVVATEIGNLANQTSTTVNEIGGIVSEVHEAVTKMASCLEDTTSFLENTVVKEFGEFENVSVQYQDDANLFKGNMADVADKIKNLSDSIRDISASIKAISDVVAESSEGVTDIANKTTNIVVKTQDNFTMMETCKSSVDSLTGIVKEFKV